MLNSLDFIWIWMFVFGMIAGTLFFGWLALRKPSQYYVAMMYGTVTMFVLLLMLCVITLP